MAKRKAAPCKPPAGIPATVQVIFEQCPTEVRRYELGVEALCDLGTEIAERLGEEDTLPKAYSVRYSGLSLAAWGESVPADLERFACPYKPTFLLFQVLCRILELTEHLFRRCGQARWESVHETIDSWLHSFGEDDTASRARARFSALTGSRHRKGVRVKFLNRALIQALSAVQA